MRNVLVTGGNGQLASCIKDITENTDGFNFIFVDNDKLDITKKHEVTAFFEKQKIEYCINCAAYTNVDKSESELVIAKNVNELGVKYLAESCNKYNAVFIQVSTDFVFDGKQSTIYTENDEANPLGVYGLTKLNGEIATAKTLKKHFIIRTSWLYSEHGNNFLKTMLRLGQEKEELNVVSDQIGTPTYAGDLAEVILKLIMEKNDSFGIYHYSNEGVASWYDFAYAIFEESNTQVKLLPIKTEAYPTPAKRPSYSVMDKSKIKNVLNVKIPYWRDSLKKCLNKNKMKKTVLIFCLVGFMISCADQKSNNSKTKIEESKKEDVKDDEKKNEISVVIRAKVTEDDVFEVYYYESGDENFRSKDFVSTKVKGMDTFQQIKFLLPNEVYPERLRLDLGKNKNQKTIKLEGVTLAYNDKEYSFSSDEIKSLRPSKFIDYDIGNLTIETKAIDNKYDPYFYTQKVNNIIDYLLED